MCLNPFYLLKKLKQHIYPTIEQHTMTTFNKDKLRFMGDEETDYEYIIINHTDTRWEFHIIDEFDLAVEWYNNKSKGITRGLYRNIYKISYKDKKTFKEQWYAGGREGLDEKYLIKDYGTENCFICGTELKRDKDGMLLCVGACFGNNSQHYCYKCFDEKSIKL